MYIITYKVAGDVPPADPSPTPGAAAGSLRGSIIVIYVRADDEYGPHETEGTHQPSSWLGHVSMATIQLLDGTKDTGLITRVPETSLIRVYTQYS